MDELIGTWKSDPGDIAGLNACGNVTLEFRADGNLLYIVHEPDRDQVMRLTFRVQAGFIITDQPSKPHPEKTAYELTQDGGLILHWGTVK